MSLLLPEARVLSGRPSSVRGGDPNAGRAGGPRQPSSLVLLLVGSFGCVRPAPPAAADAALPVSPGDGSFVLVWTDARVYRSPEDERPARAYDFGASRRAARGGEVYVARLVADHGEWVQIKTGPIDWLNADGRLMHCASSDMVDGVALNLWVQRHDLAPALVAPFERSFGDGTFLRLAPGTPVVDGRPWVEGLLLPVDLSEEMVGIGYRPQPYAGIEVESRFARLGVSRMAARLDGREVTWSQPPWDYNDPPVFLIDPSSSRITSLDSGCGAIELAFEGDTLDLTSRGIGGGFFGDVEDPSPRMVIPGGAPLTWPDGAPAGVVLDALHLPIVSSGPRACFQVPLGSEWRSPGYQSANLEVCAPAQD